MTKEQVHAARRDGVDPRWLGRKAHALKDWVHLHGDLYGMKLPIGGWRLANWSELKCKLSYIP